VGVSENGASNNLTLPNDHVHRENNDAPANSAILFVDLPRVSDKPK
jgi:hypothetical protein